MTITIPIMSNMWAWIQSLTWLQSLSWQYPCWSCQTGELGFTHSAPYTVTMSLITITLIILPQTQSCCPYSLKFGILYQKTISPYSLYNFLKFITERHHTDKRDPCLSTWSTHTLCSLTASCSRWLFFHIFKHMCTQKSAESGANAFALTSRNIGRDLLNQRGYY